MNTILTNAFVLSLLFTQVAYANIEVDFIEGAPKDRFVIKNIGSCALSNVNVKIDLSQSAGKLIFDTTATGAGVEVFQPFEVTSGNITLASNSKVKDGDSTLALNIANLSSGKSASFTIDVDDTLKNSKLGMIRVANSEIQNGTVTISSDKQIAATGIFGGNSKASIAQQACSTS